MVNLSLGTWIKAAMNITSFRKRHQSGGFRIGQSYSPALVKQVAKRDDVAFMWTTDIVYRAMSDGYTIHDSEDEEPEWIDEFLSLGWLKNHIRGAAMERIDGAVTFALMYTSLGVYDIIPFDTGNTKFLIDKYANFIEFILTEKIGGSHSPLEHDPITGSDLENVFHEVLRPGEYRYEGNSVLEPIWDLMNERQIVLQSAALISARLAAGLRKATVAVRQGGGDDKAVSDAEIGLMRLEADDTTIVLRSGYDSEGRPWEDKLEVDTGGSQFNYLDKMEIITQGLSIATGIPANYFKGIFFGSLYASDSILRQLHTALTRIQFDWTYRIEEHIQRWCELAGKNWEEDYHLVWNLKPQLTEQEQALMDKVIADKYVQYKNAGILTLPEIREELGYDPNIEIEQPKSIFTVEGLKDEEEEE